MNTVTPPPPFSGDEPTKHKRRLLPYLGGGLLIALIVAGMWPRALPVEIAEITRGTLRVTIDEEGQTRVKNRYVISSPVFGQLRRISLRAGDAVVAGQTEVAVIETSAADMLDARSLAQAEARVRGAESARDAAAARRESAHATQTLAAADLKRMQALVAQGASTTQESDTATARAATAAQEARAAEFSLQVAGFELEQARALVARGVPGSAETPSLEINSPVSGRVLRVLQESSRVVTAGIPLIEVGDLRDMEVKIEVLSRDGVAIAPGTRVLLEQWGGAEALEARVRLVEPAAFTKVSALGVEEQRVNVIADFTDAADKRAMLGDAYRVEARIVAWEGVDVLTVPSGALFQEGKAWRAYVVDGGRARLRELKVGRGNGVATQVLDGLRAGDRVIVYPGDRVQDGSRVRGLTVSRP
jgi:HlyD family secretion protein